MMRPVTVWLALRYLGRQRGNRFAAFVGMASVVGVALGVTALIVVLSVMNGFEGELRSRLVAITGHATLLTGLDEPGWRAIQASASRHPGIVAATPYIEVEAMAGRDRELAGVIIEGIEPRASAGEAALPGLNLQDGSLDALRPGSGQVLVGRALALRLGVAPGDRLRVLVPLRQASGRVGTRLRELTVAGLFEIGIIDHDAQRLFVHLDDAALLAGATGGVSGIRLRMADVMAAPAVVAAWQAAWRAGGGQVPAASDWTIDHASYFRAVRIEKTMMTLLLSLIVLVAAFNIVATLVMVVGDRRPGIAILRTLGYSRRAIVVIFGLQGLLIGWAGVLAGVAGGVTLVRHINTVVPALERAFGFQFMPADVYYLTRLPARIDAVDVLWVVSIALLLTAVATVYPALRAAGVAPGEVLRYE